MFSFFHRNKLLSEVDIHSHLIPAIDDGAKNIGTAITLIKRLKKIGYKKLIITPHVSDMFPNSSQRILKKFLLLKEEIKREEIDIELDIGAEYYIDENFENLLEKNDILSFGDKNYLLFEFSYFSPPMDMDNLVYEITRKGYTPILAHPERYIYWHDSFYQYEQLKEMDVLFQININSITGFYNKGVQETVQKLILNGMVDFIGSDLHHNGHLKSLEKAISLSLYKKIPKYNKILNSTLLHKKSMRNLKEASIKNRTFNH